MSAERRVPHRRGGSDGPDPLDALVGEVRAAHDAGPKHRHRFHAAVDALVDLDGIEGSGAHRPERALGHRLRSTVTELWERGWEPGDLGHVVRRHLDPRAVRLLAATMADALSTLEHRALLPDRWRSQCAALDAEPGTDPDRDGDAVVAWRQAEGLDVGTALEAAVQLWAALDRLPELDHLGPPPSRWTAGPSGPPADPKLLTMIRALLAKAESTSFPAEAEAFAVKAQSLMTRHAIDAAVLAAASPLELTGAVRLRRIPVDDPYSTEKAGLLHVVADLNDVETVWDDRFGLATVIGFPADLDVVELLFTSLLIQATRAVNDPANASPDRRAPSFRRAFLLAYADRIAQRLQQARDHAGRRAAFDHGPGLVPVLAARRAAVAAVTDERYPQASAGRTRLVDARGWAAGREAADRARLRP